MLSEIQSLWTGWESFTWILLISGIPIFSYWIRSRSTFVQLINAIPGPSPLPILGNILDVFRIMDENFIRTAAIDWVNHYGPITRAWLCFRPIVGLSSPETIQVILSSQKYITKSFVYSFLSDWLGESLAIVGGEKWRNRRRLLTPAFHFEILHRSIDILNDKSKECAEEFERTIATAEVNEEEIDVCPIMTQCALDILCEISMGRRNSGENKNENENYRKNFNRFGEIAFLRVFYPWLTSNWSFKLTGQGRESKKCIKALNEFTNKAIRDRRNMLKQQEEKIARFTSKDDNDDEESFKKPQKERLAFLDLLIKASENGSLLSDDDLRQEVDIIMVAGHDTTAATMSWFLYCIAKHPNEQQRAVDELHSVFGDSDRVCTSIDVAQLKYLECCIKETLRLYPVIPAISRCLTEDVVIDKYTVPASTTIVINIYGMHHNPEIYPDPETFKPERFYPENSVGRHPYAFIPFSAGPRNCIGQKYAMLEMKVVLANLLRRFRFSVTDTSETMVTPTVDSAGIMKPNIKGGLRVIVSKRSKKRS